jgi:hypothetical protein
MSKIFKTRGDKMTAIMMAVVTVIIGGVFIVNKMANGNQQDSSSKSYVINDADRKSIESTIKEFISTDGTFGLDWNSIRKDSSVDISDLRDEWLSADVAKSSIPDKYADMITTRSMVISKLIQPRSGGAPSVLSSDSKLARLGSNDLHVMSDSLLLSQFKTDSSTVTIDWKSANATSGDSGIITNVTIGWTSSFTRSTKTPDAYLNTKIADWSVETTAIPFDNVNIGLEKVKNSDSGSEWQVVTVGNANGKTDLDNGSVLATIGDISYDNKGAITARNVNEDQARNDGE